MTSASRSRSRIASASPASDAESRASSTLTGSGGSCFTPGGPRLHEDVAADVGRERAHDLSYRRREDVDAAHDQHVVGAPDAAHARARAPARAWAGPEPDVVARAKAQQRRRAVAEVGQHELALGAVVDVARGAGFRVDQLGMDEPARAEVHAVLLLAFAPQRRADVADAHRLRHAGAPALFEHCAESRLAAARLARDQHARDARPAQVEAPLGRPLDEVGGVGGSDHRSLGLQQVDREHQPLRVAGADRDVRDADALEGVQRRARHERAGVVGGDDALPRGHAGGRVAAGRPGHPVVEVAGGQRDVAGRAGGAAGRVDPRDLGRRRAQVRADRIVRRGRGLDLGLLGQRQLRDLRQPARVGWGLDTRRGRACRGRTRSARTDRRAGCGTSRRRAASCSAQGRVSTSGWSIGLVSS